MKAFLMHRSRDFDPNPPPLYAADDLIADLHLTTLFDAMGMGDDFVTNVASRAILSSLTTVDEITYRQEVLADCLAHPSVVRELYAVAVEAIRQEQRGFLGILERPDMVVRHAVAVLEIFVGMFRRLRAIADHHAGEWHSAGFTAFFAMVVRELDDAYLSTLDGQLDDLRFRDGVLISGRLGPDGRGTDQVLRRPGHRTGWRRLLTYPGPKSYTFRIPEVDQRGVQGRDELRDRGLDRVAEVLRQSTDHILAFFTTLRCELAFYVGCLNLYERLRSHHLPICRPEPLPLGHSVLECRALYDVCLALQERGERVVGNDISARDADLIVITGANEGGKSTLLRAIGLAYLMMQCGMFPAGEAFSAGVRPALFTHFKRAEDADLNSGKLDEELSRMAGIADHLTPGALVLFNESFAATNEREGSQINREIIHALRDGRVAVVTVTHLYDLALDLYEHRTSATVFLRAQRRDDGRRTYKVIPGAPLPTSFGADLYRRIFDSDP
jgi:ABC-type iron transport system FetAB ATPase subunit